MSTLSRRFVHGLKKRAQAVLETNEKGLEVVEWIFMVVGILGIAVIVVAAVNAFVTGQISLFPG